MQRRMVLAVLTSIVLLSLTIPACSKVVYVTPNGNDTNTGLSWELAKKSITSALSTAVSGDEVWVAAGVYVERITLKSGVGLYGGFAGSETRREQREWRANTTVIDGSSGGTVVTVPQDATSATIIDGFTIRNGHGSSAYGGGIYNSGSPIISHNIITNNSADFGGGIYCSGSPRIENNVLAGNDSIYRGGGIYCTGCPAIVSNTIVGNSSGVYCSAFSALIADNIIAFNHNGIYSAYSYSGAPTLKNNCVYGNPGYNYSGVTPGATDISVDPKLASTAYRNMHIQPDSPCIDAGDSTQVLAGSLDTDGQARVQGASVDIGADESDGTLWNVTPAVVRVSPEGNDSNDGSSWALAKKTVQGGIDAAAEDGGEVWVKAGVYYEHIVLKPYAHLYGGFDGSETDRSQRSSGAAATVLDGGRSGTVVKANAGVGASGIDGFTIRNSMPSYGGAITCSFASPVISNNVITEGGVGCSDSSAALVNNTIVGCNTGVYCSYSCSPLILNNVISFNVAGVYSTGTGTPSLRHNCIYGNTSYNYSGVSAGEGDISVDPEIAGLGYGDVHIQPSSPCIDAGDDSALGASWVDMDGQSRLQGAHVDIGADESDGTTWTPTPVVIRVDGANGTDSNDGSSWAAAKQTVQTGVDAASIQGGEVWVKAGTYRERITLWPFTHIYGGFAGDETTKDQRDLAKNVTILDGEHVGSVITVPSGQYMSTIDGFVIRNGSATYGGGIYCSGASPEIANNVITGNTATTSGGGICCMSGSSPNIRGNLIKANFGPSNSGGIYSSSCAPSITNNTVIGNSGGITLSISTAPLFAPTVANNIVAFNSTGIKHSGSPVPAPVLRNNCVYGNPNGNYFGISAGAGDFSIDPELASTAYGNVHLRASSPCVDAGDETAVSPGWTDIDGQPRTQGTCVDVGADESDGSSPTVSPLIVRVDGVNGSDDNDGSSWSLAMKTVQAGIDAASTFGGEVWIREGTYRERVILLAYCYVYGGFGGSETSRSERSSGAGATVLDGEGGGTVVTARTGVGVSALDGFTIRGAGAGSGGGLFCSDAASPTISSNIVADGGVCCSGSSPIIVGNTIAGNSVPALDCLDCSPTVTNNIIAFNAAGIQVAGSHAPVLSHNCVYGNTRFDYSGIPDETGTNGNILLDPKFANLYYGDLHIQPDSPCIDAGDDTAVIYESGDMDGQPRVQGEGVDIGADESDGTTWSVTGSVFRVDGVNGDDGNDGSAWDKAKKTIQAAVDAASAQGGEVWVKAGTYDETITLKSSVYLYGGFAGSETEREQRNDKANITILDGQQSGSVVTISDVGYLRTTIDGFTIRNGNAAAGGGIYCSNASPLISNNVITGNFAVGDDLDLSANLNGGGGIYCSDSSPIIAGNTISGNVAALNGYGGGISCCYSAPFICNNSIVSNLASNSPGVGGGIWVYYSPAMIVNNTIALNSAGDGGGIGCCQSFPVITNNIVSANSSGVYAYSQANPALSYNCVSGNSEYDYWGVYPGPTDINTDPLLAGTAVGNVHIQPDSPCIDAGDEYVVQSWWTDVDGQPRVQGITVDIGADESDRTVWNAATPVVRVDGADGSDANDGATWDGAKKTVQAGIDTAASLGGGEVWVKAGIYNERITLKPYTYLYGGFTGSETQRGQRDWKANVTILDGQQSGRVVRIAAPGYQATRIDGFTVRNGKADAGGGIYCLYSSPAILNNNVVGNSTDGRDSDTNCGAGIYCSHSSPVIAENTITGNVLGGTSYGRGGGIFGLWSDLSVSGNQIVSNGPSGISSIASGIYYSQSSGDVRNNLIAANTKYGIDCIDSSPNITNNTITGNRYNGVYTSNLHTAYSRAVAMPRIANNIIAFNASYGVANNYPSYMGYPIVRSNCVFGNTSGNFSGFNADPADNIQVDPQFRGSTVGDYHLWITSPCVDAGDDSLVPSDATDVDGQPRLIGAHVDIGADEYGPMAAVPLFSPDGGTYDAPLSVTVASTESDAAVHYTTDGSDPTEADPVAVEPIPVNQSLILKARAYRPECAPSAIKSALYTVQGSAPTGVILINSGAPYTQSTLVTLTLDAPDNGQGVSQMRLSNDGITWNSWVTYMTTGSHRLTTGDGCKTVYGQFKDSTGAVYLDASATILLDSTAPTGLVAINGGAAFTASQQVTLDLWGSDAGSGVSLVRFSSDGSTWTDWETYATSRDWTLTSGDGEKAVYVQFQDAVGRVSSNCTDTITLDTSPPSGSVTINGGDQFAISRSVTLALTAADTGSPVAEMRFKNGSGVWSSWEAFAAGKPWTLDPGDGIKTVYAQFKDQAGYVSPSCSDTIDLETTPPVVETVSDDGVYTTGLTSLHASWNASDSRFGVAEIQYAIGTSPSDMVTNWVSADTASEATEDGLTLQQDQTYYWYIKAKNGLGVWSEPVSSDGITAAAPASVGKARLDEVGSAVYTEGVVTSTPTDGAGFWIESADRSSGIAISSDWSVSRGEALQVAGIVSVVDGVFSLSAPELKGRSPGGPMTPVGAANAQLANDRRESLEYLGINPVGLLVTTWGTVTSVDPVGRVFYIDDGSQLTDGVGPTSGLRIIYGPEVTPPNVGEIVSVTGIRTVEKAVLAGDASVNGELRLKGEEVYLPEICLRDQADLVGFGM